MMTSLLARGLRSIGAAVLEALSYVGLLAVFYGKLSVLLWSVPSRPRLLLSQLYVVGSRSLAITL
ncbi:MAG: hypothetical protein EBX70_10000, partial [Betaproteobacteria bacterium]|nr:hypothetical protein [Betaproteobacteria bacterium]